MLLEPYQAGIVQELLNAPDVELASLARIEAYTTRQRALTAVPLPAGIVDLGRDIPSEDKTLLASATNLVMRRDLNPTMGRSMIIASLVLNSEGDYFSKPYSFPNLEATDLPVLKEYVDFFDRVKSGAFSFESRLPFWVAHTLERVSFFLIPIGLLLALLGISFGAGLLAAIVALIVAAVVLLISDKFLPGMEVHVFLGALVAAVGIGVVGWLVTWLLSLIGITV
jgi:hypothetical protein